MTTEKEMSLAEWMATLPSHHRANKEYQALLAAPVDGWRAKALEALEPFANEAVEWGPFVKDAYALGTRFTVGDLRRAREAYVALKEG